MVGCFPGTDFQSEFFISDADYVEYDRELSPDSTKFLLSYAVNIGALGFAMTEYSLLKLSDTLKNIRDYKIQSNLKELEWVNNDTITGIKDMIPQIRKGNFNTDVIIQQINNVTILGIPFDHIEADYSMHIEYRQTSPNGKNELIAYRYCKDRKSLNFIHISVIENGTEIPKYGNYFIGTIHSDYILGGHWNKENNLDFYHNEYGSYDIEKCFVKNKPDIKYNLIQNHTLFEHKNRWVKNYR
jgi:hypothetical protein